MFDAAPFVLSRSHGSPAVLTAIPEWLENKQNNETMKLAAVKALADLAKEAVPEIVNIAYNKKNIVFGKDYFIPKPLDPRLITKVAPAVAKAAMESGVARKQITDWNAYEGFRNSAGRFMASCAVPYSIWIADGLVCILTAKD